MWSVKFHPLVLKEDFKKIDPESQKRIVKQIAKKLRIDPEKYGKALSGGLHGYWRLRAGDYRVIYRIIKDRIEVLVVKVGIRRDLEVYEKFLLRLKKMGEF
ncbi:MAG: type II toxin-antitoxin system RelE/ParE family toxin [Candidatus Omnitrophica bacterium]|nr:type II toxin-antitoxin system RelE/ParE family toxin [Candidatus Omnitrophota bacterium]MBU4590792.1 type II toxin-antitoxin system RelE/ParE family toxin [Candidatus Omnitrophota bacterium]